MLFTFSFLYPVVLDDFSEHSVCIAAPRFILNFNNPFALVFHHPWCPLHLDPDGTPEGFQFFCGKFSFRGCGGGGDFQECKLTS